MAAEKPFLFVKVDLIYDLIIFTHFASFKKAY